MCDSDEAWCKEDVADTINDTERLGKGYGGYRIYRCVIRMAVKHNVGLCLGSDEGRPCFARGGNQRASGRYVEA